MTILDGSRAASRASKTPNPDRTLIADAKKAARAAARAEFRCDELFSAEISKIISVANSAIKRHGPLIERAIAEALESAGLEVLRNVPFPITSAAIGMATSSDYSQIANKQIDFDAPTVIRHVDFDLIIIDAVNRWIGGFQLKRGGGQTQSRMRRVCEPEIRAANFILASWARQKGYRTIETGVAAVIDYYGQSGFATDLTINREEIDDFFELPIVASVDQMTAAMSGALADELRGMFAAIAPTVATPAHNDGSLNANDALPTSPLRFRRRSHFRTIAAMDMARSFPAGDGRH